MRKTRTKIPNKLTSAETFFIEKTYELLSEDTIDTYRLRLHNPRTILVELEFLITSVINKNISEDYAKAVCDEAIDLLALDKELAYKQLQKDYFLRILGRKELSKVHYAVKLILDDNKTYLEDLIAATEAEIQLLNTLNPVPILAYKNLNRVTSFLYVEFRRKGFNKRYIHRTMRAIFSSSSGGANFSNRFDGLKAIARKTPEKFTVYILIETQGSLQYLRDNPVPFTFQKRGNLLAQAIEMGNSSLEEFIKQVAEEHIYSIEVNALDYYSATIEARKLIQRNLDFCYLGDPKDYIRISSKCFVVGTVNPTKSKPQNLNYKLDGELRGSYTIYQHFVRRLKDSSAKRIDPKAMVKLYSGLRYLRLGSEASSEEHRLINYWIAMEFIFSSADGGGNKTTRLKEYFKKIHGYSYARKLFADLHKSIYDFGLTHELSLFNASNITYLLDKTSESELASFEDQYPLLNYRLLVLKQRFADGKAISKELERHMNNLERNILRIYRVRNTIVHDAVPEIISDDIFDLSVHLKYYLTFIINGLLDFLIDHPIALNGDGISIDDYFSVVSMKLDSLLLNDTATVQDLLMIKSPIEYLR